MIIQETKLALTIVTLSFYNSIAHALIWDIPYRSVGGDRVQPIHDSAYYET